MTPEMQARVFEPFYTTKFTGRGLGLAVVHGIVRGHRGGVRVESAPQLGSTFSVALPAITQPADPLSRLAPSTDAWRSTGVVLVADDEDLVRDVADTMLRQIGFEVVAVQDGREAVQAFAADPHRFDLVLLDLTMPIMSGSEALQAIRQIRPDVPVLIMSGYNEQDTRRPRRRPARRIPPQTVLSVDLTRPSARGPGVGFRSPPRLTSLQNRPQWSYIGVLERFALTRNGARRGQSEGEP